MSRYNLNSKKLQRPQVVLLLDFLGMPINEQPKSVKEKRDLLELKRQTDSDAFDIAYQIIVLHKLPTESKDNSENMLREIKMKFSEVLYDTAGAIKSDADKKIANLVNDYLIALYNQAREDAEKAIKEAAKRFEKIQVKVGNKKPKTLDFTMPSEFPRLLDLASARKNVLMVGPAGCGKTFIASKIAEGLDLDFASQSCSEGMSESNLTGWLLPVEGNGKFSYIQSEFVRIYENGGVFLFDEIDSSDPNVMVYLNQALANDGFYLPQRHKNPHIKKHKDFVGVAAANTFGNGGDAMYVGRNQLDAATLDRFRVGTVAMDYDEQVERSLASDEVYDWAINIRGKINSHRMRRIMSTRIMKDAQTMVSEFDWSIDKVAEGYFMDWSDEEKRMVDYA